MWGGLLQDTVSPLGDMVHFELEGLYLSLRIILVLMFNLVYIEAISASLMESARFRFP
jgi:hypothetical protein